MNAMFNDKVFQSRRCLTFVAIAFAALFHKNAAALKNNYSMYVWNDGLDPSECDGVYKSKKDHPECFIPVWETPIQRSHLWAACQIKGREVERIFLSKVKTRIENSNCDPVILDTLQEAHDRSIQVYALFATSNAEFSEKEDVIDAVDFNNHCANETAFFDGVAINNEHFGAVKNCDIETNGAERIQFLDNLFTAKENAAPLPLHFSVGWHWGMCSVSDDIPLVLEWGGHSKTALEHMMDIADSVDVQVARNHATGSSNMADRAVVASYDFWADTQNGKSETAAYYVLAYCNPNSDCRLSFSPHVKGSPTPTDTCNFGDRTEAGMWDAFDIVTSALPIARGGIHFMGGVYSTGITNDWPRHTFSSKYERCVRKAHRKKYVRWVESLGWKWTKVDRKYKKALKKCLKKFL